MGVYRQVEGSDVPRRTTVALSVPISATGVSPERIGWGASKVERNEARVSINVRVARDPPIVRASPTTIRLRAKPFGAASCRKHEHLRVRKRHLRRGLRGLWRTTVYLAGTAAERTYFGIGTAGHTSVEIVIIYTRHAAHPHQHHWTIKVRVQSRRVPRHSRKRPVSGSDSAC